VNRSTEPSESLLLRTPILPSGRFATSTQLLLEKLRELLTQDGPELRLPRPSPEIGLATSTSLNVGVIYDQNMGLLRSAAYQLLSVPDL
jgi:hypothetical protein